LQLTDIKKHYVARALSENERNRRLFINELDSAGSRKEYSRCLGEFLLYLRRDFSINELKTEREHINAFKNYLFLNKQNSKSTVNKKLSVISGYFIFLIEKRVLAENPCEFVRRFKMANIGKSVAITREEIERIYRSLSFNTFYEIQKKTLIVLLFESGIRISEMLNLKISSLKKDYGEYILEFEQKGGRNHRIKLNDLSIAYLGRYLEELALLGEIDPNTHLFLTRKRRLLDRNNFAKMLKRVAINAGLDTAIHPHSARVSYIKKRNREGADIYTIRKEVGHSSVRTTERYLG
jgi:integrase/recombinase XerD